MIGTTPMLVPGVRSGPSGGTAFDQMIVRLQEIDDTVHSSDVPSWAREDLFVAMAAHSIAGLEPHDPLGWRLPQSVTGGGYVTGGFDGEILARDGWNPEFTMRTTAQPVTSSAGSRWAISTPVPMPGRSSMRGSEGTPRAHSRTSGPAKLRLTSHGS